MNKINYDLVMQNEIKNLKGKSKPKLLLHACCAPCASFVLEQLVEHFDITIYFYNPNITDDVEYKKRLNELKSFVYKIYADRIVVVEGDYVIEDFYNAITGLESQREGGLRCYNCYELRLANTANYAKANNFDYFCTVLSISPHKNAQFINQIGQNLQELVGIKFLYSDFKKRGGYKRSVEISNENNLYRQDYCGCEFSKIK